MQFQKKSRKLNLKQLFLLVFTLFLAMIASAFVYATQVSEVTINNKGKITTVKTMAKTVEDLLKELKVKYEKSDIVSPGLQSSLTPQTKITIYSEVAKMEKKNVNSALAVGLQPKQKESKDVIIKDKNVVAEKNITINKKMAFKVEKKKNSRLYRGQTKTVKKGTDGIIAKQYKVVYKNGKEVSRTLLSSKVVKKPINKVVEEGTMNLYVTSRGESIRFRKVIEMKSYAYDNGVSSTGKHPGDSGYGVTASGMKTRKGVVAVDPRVIPLGTRLYVESVKKGVTSYGYAIAADTGGAIKGNKIDLFFPTSREVDNWGVKKVKVYILE